MAFCFKHNNFCAWLFVVIALVLLSACRQNRLDADISNIEVNLKVKRFEKSLFEVNTDKLPYEIVRLDSAYGNFFGNFTKGVINIGKLGDPGFEEGLRGFITDQNILEVYHTAEKVFEDLKPIENELEDAFKRYKFYFPEKPIPEVFTYISGFNYAIVATDSVLGIGLDMYLGSSSEYYKRLGIPQYKTHNMSKEFIASDCMRGWLTSDFVLDGSDNSLLAQMIYYGRVLYFLDAVFPDMDDSLKIGFTQKQLEWCRSNEAQMWAFLIENKMLYSSDYKETVKYTGEAPFTTGFPSESPGRSGWWIGWQIIKSYMRVNEAVTLNQLLNEKDARNILTKSKYKPNK